MRRLKLPCDDITPIGLWGSDMFLIGVNNDQFEVLRLWNVQTEDVTPATLRDLHTESPAIPTSPSAGNAASGARSSATGAPAGASPTTSSAPIQRASSVSALSSDSSAEFSYQPTAVHIDLDREPEPAMPDSSIARGSDPLEVQPAFASLSQAPAPEASGTRSVTGSRGAGAARGSNGAMGTPTATPPAAAAPSETPDLRLEPSIGSASRGGRTETRSSRGDAAKAAPAPAAASAPAAPAAVPKEAAKDSSNAGKLRMTVDGEHLYAEIKGGKIVLKDRTYDSLAHARDSIRRERNKVAVWEYFDEGVKAWRVLNRD